MNKVPIRIKKKILFALAVIELVIVLLVGRLFYLQSFKAEKLQKLALEQHTRDRLIPPRRGSILDRNGKGIAITKSVSSISAIPVQTRGNEEKIALSLAAKLDLDYNIVYKRLKNNVALERIKTKVEKELADEIREMNLPGIVVDEDIQRLYPYKKLASQVIGFVGKDNQGIIGLEAYYEEYLKGSVGKILTETDAKGKNLKNTAEQRIEPIQGFDLNLSIDVTIQEYAEQVLEKIVTAKQAKKGAIVVMNPFSGEIYALANEPGFDLNEPFAINDEGLSKNWQSMTEEQKSNALNQMWRNSVINDTYEPGSTFKIITSAAGLEEGVIDIETKFKCQGFHTVGGRMIRCWRYPNSHGEVSFLEGVQVSCNPVFMSVAEKLGAEKFYDYLKLFEFDKKTGVDLPGEAVGIMHKLENVASVELATMSFGQSFQITPLQLLRAASASINGGNLITPHVGVKITDEKSQLVKVLEFEESKQVISKETSDTMRFILETVVSTGTGNRTYLPGYRVGGKTATSEKLPRKTGKYISSFLAFAPAEKPKVIAIVMVDEPKGAYYGGQVTGPVMKELLANILPYLGIEHSYSEQELLMKDLVEFEMPNFIGLTKKEVAVLLKENKLEAESQGENDTVSMQFPQAGELVNPHSKIILLY